LIPGLFALTLVIGGCAQQSSDQMSNDMATDTMAHDGDGMSMDATVVAPDVYTVIHEDERVRILDMKLPAGVTDGMHSHPDEAVYFIKGSKLRIHLPDGESMEMDVPDGAPLSHEAWTHTVENIGDSLLHAVVFELKEGARDSAGVIPEGMGAAETSPDVYSVLLEDERVRILEMKLPAGQSDNEHVHTAEAVYFLSGGRARIHLPNGEVIEAEVPDGGFLSNPMWQHRVENVGESEVHAVIVELKE
ncbi:MAG TPA: hypothetical protein VMO47_09000, partial [Rhodothermales bacterium]|nr:hypothetical protein [Rhodothermales bacterium]